MTVKKSTDRNQLQLRGSTQGTGGIEQNKSGENNVSIPKKTLELVCQEVQIEERDQGQTSSHRADRFFKDSLVTLRFFQQERMLFISFVFPVLSVSLHMTSESRTI